MIEGHPIHFHPTAEILQTIVEQAETDKSSYLAFLDHLLKGEVAAKDTVGRAEAVVRESMENQKICDNWS